MNPFVVYVAVYHILISCNCLFTDSTWKLHQTGSMLHGQKDKQRVQTGSIYSVIQKGNIKFIKCINTKISEYQKRPSIWKLEEDLLLISVFSETILYHTYSLYVKNSKINFLFDKDCKNLIFFRKSKRGPRVTGSIKGCLTGSKKQSSAS